MGAKWWDSPNARMGDWKGKRAWIVGASSGIGLALADALADRGALVAVSARSASALQAWAGARAGARAIPMDCADPFEVKAAAREALSDGLDLVCFCAATYQPMRAQGIDADAIERHMRVNMQAAARVAQEVLPSMMVAGAGHLSFASSAAANFGLPKALAYGPTKAALASFAQSLWCDVSAMGVGVSVASPGFVRTGLTALNDFEMPFLMEPSEAAERWIRGLEQGRFEIAFPWQMEALTKMLRWLPERVGLRLARRAGR